VRTLGIGVCLWRFDRRVDCLDAFGAEHLIEGGAELAVAVVNEEARPLENAGKGEVARLLHDPGARRVGGAAGQVTPRLASSMKKNT
jgi:hypothetical protein